MPSSGVVPVRAALITFALIPCALDAQSVPTSPRVPIINLPPATATTTETLGAVLGLRQVAGDKVLVNDARRRQIKLFDASLATSTIVLDSAAGSSNSYGPIGAPLIPYVGDSSLFANRGARSVLVFDERGQVARALALPNPADFGSLQTATGGVDSKGRLIYLGSNRGMPMRTALGIGFPDSIPILRADFDLRRVDTIARVNRPLAKATAATKASNGVTYTMFAIDPLKTIDEWSVLSNGSVALVRGHDYHIDWIHSDGTVGSTAKMPFDWKRLTDEDKQKLADSARVAQNARLADDTFESELTMVTKGNFDVVPGGGGGVGEKSSGGRGGSGGAGGGEAPPGRAPSEHGRGYLPREAEVIPLNQIADYYPPIRIGATIPDLDGNLWILPTTSAQSQHGELVYDVVNARGELFQRVRMPAGRSVAGFGKGGVVYMISGDKTNGFHLERSGLPPK